MKITVKTFKGNNFQIDVAEQDTIASVKDRIKESEGHDVLCQKLIYSGKILLDDSTIKSNKINEDGFLVLMISQPKVKLPSTMIPSMAPAPATPELPAPPSIRENPASPTENILFGGGSFLSGDALQTTIQNMIEMGFPRDQVLLALRASYNNPDRAVEYLMNGIPSYLHTDEPSQTSGASIPTAIPTPSAPVNLSSNSSSDQYQNLFQLAQQQQQRQTTGQGGGGGVGISGDRLSLEGFRNHPAIAQIRDQIAVNPENAGPTIQQLARANPQLAGALAQNPDALMELLGIDFSDEPEGELPSGTMPLRIEVTEEERAAIRKLEDLGFSFEDATEAYFAADKNEEIAANMLFEGTFRNL